MSEQKKKWAYPADHSNWQSKPEGYAVSEIEIGVSQQILTDWRYSFKATGSLDDLRARYRRTCWLTFAALHIASLSAIQLCLATVRSKIKLAKATLRASEPGKESSSLADNPAAASPPSKSRRASFSL